jgi:hypothetical protein
MSAEETFDQYFNAVSASWLKIGDLEDCPASVIAKGFEALLEVFSSLKSVSAVDPFKYRKFVDELSHST